jgi:hypothetical protein
MLDGYSPSGLLVLPVQVKKQQVVPQEIRSFADEGDFSGGF